MSVTVNLQRLALINKLPSCCVHSILRTQFYATAPKPYSREPSAEEKVEKLQTIIKRVTNKPTEDTVIFLRPSGDIFEYNRRLRSKHPTPDQRQRISGEVIKKSLENPTSIEDFLYVKPANVQPFPAIVKLPGIYAGLSKSRLTMLVVLTAMGGYGIAPGVFDPASLGFLSLGTFLQSAAANATNQVIEVNREHAAVFALLSGLTGTGILLYGVNTITCGIGFLNYLLYTSVYTPMKRMSIMNTWIGSIVGALPPLMGWTAATGSVDIGGLWLALLLYIWQFPHFKALSWNIKADYKRAGYCMSSVINPDMCKSVAFRHTIFMTAACFLGPAANVTTNMFILYSLPCNLYGVYLGWKFYSSGDSSSSRNLFRFSLMQIPYLIIMMLISKKWQQDSENNMTTNNNKTDNTRTNNYSSSDSGTV